MLSLLAGCSSSTFDKEKPSPAPNRSKPGKRQLLSEPASTKTTAQLDRDDTSIKQSNVQQPAVKIGGAWKVGFQFGKKNLTSTVTFIQEGNAFHGEGQDDQTKKHFAIEQGQIEGDNIRFSKNYNDHENQPVDYTGTFQILKVPNYAGPYLSGRYQCGKNNRIISGDWEAEPVADKPDAANEPVTNEQSKPLSENNPTPNAPPPAEAPTDHAPQLSGKWNVGFEYDFKTVHSTMYLEQDKGTLTGHGFDEETKEKFVITKGWYNYPRITLVRSYAKSKSSGISRTVTFRATVTSVNDKDYQGPYLRGKTQGGGDWEAQLIK
jgi:hypothetical protein